MAASNYKGAKQLTGITGQQSGDNLTLVQQRNAVIRAKRMTPKRKRKIVINETLRMVIQIILVVTYNHITNGCN